jgi:ribosomal-protein-alanine N-acetyltransferase
MKKDVIMSSHIVLRKVAKRYEKKFLSAATISREFHQHWVSVPKTSKAFRRYVKVMNTASEKSYLVWRKDNKDLAGVIELQDIYKANFKNAYVIYYAFDGNQGEGLMAEAMREVIRIAFKKLKLHRLEANIQPDNKASRHLAKACGFRKEGIARQFLKKGGEWRDHERWALLSTDVVG